MKPWNRIIWYIMTVLLAVFASGCEIVGDIFEAGVWSGIILVVGGILLLVFLVTRVFRGRK